MKRLILVILLALLVPLAASAKEYSATFNGADVRTTLQIITKTTGYDFVYQQGLIDQVNEKVNGTYKNVSITELLDNTILYQLGLSYKIVDKSISLQKAKPEEIVKTIKGVVVDEEGEPLPGATVMVKGTSNITAADINGSFEINVKGQNPVLQVTYLGMHDVEYRLTAANSSKPLNIVLRSDITMMQEVVVTGYQTISKERTTGAFTQIDKSQLETKRINNLSNLLEGEIAGYSDGMIRGVTSMSNTSPLYVIDGFPVENITMKTTGALTEDLPDLNLNDIESITVLKDASATSIYGARAANGVIVITTKSQRKTKKPEIHFSAQLSWTPYNNYSGNVADSELTVELVREWEQQNPNLHGNNVAQYVSQALDNRAYPGEANLAVLNYYAGKISEAEKNRILDNLAGQGYRMYDQIKKYAKRTSLEQQYNMSIQHGTDRNIFKGSVTYKHTAGNDLYSNDRSVGVDLYNTTKITSWLQLDLGVYLKYGEAKNQLGDAMYWDGMPYDYIVNEDGTPRTITMEERFAKTTMDTYYNKYNLLNMDVTPLEEIKHSRQTVPSLSNRSVARLTIKFAPWLNYTAAFQYERAYTKYKNLYGAESLKVKDIVNKWSTDAGKGDGSVTQFIAQKDFMQYDESNRTAYNIRQQLNFDKTFNKVHNVTAIFGTETRENKTTAFKDEYYEWDEQLLSYKVLDYATLSSAGMKTIFGKQKLSDARVFNEATDRYFSLYGNAAYSYDGRYSITGSLRWDRSNLWGTGNKYQKYPFWSVGASWIISKEKFFNVDWVQYLKLRVSNGVGGNISKVASPYIVASYGYNSNVGATSGKVSRLPNNNLTWEKTNTFNVGLDFSILDNRLSGSIEYYNKNSTDLLCEADGNAVSGYGTSMLNSASMTNKGLEVTLNGTILRKGDWLWDAGLTFAANKNAVTETKLTCPYVSARIQNPWAYPVDGTPYYSLWCLNWAGLDENGLPSVYDSKGERAYKMPDSGDFDSLVRVGTTVPKYNGSFNTHITWKNLTLSAQLVFAGGHVARNTNTPFMGIVNASQVGTSTSFGTISSMLKDRWREPGDEKHTNVPRAIFSENSEYPGKTLSEIYMFSSINVLKMDYVKINNISLIYRLPKDICTKLSTPDVRVQATVDRPFFWAKSEQAKYQLGGFAGTAYTLGVFVNF
ncbi:MAG: SusC/RagA family TonB-linked outer membrane protein [Bacteroidales bacterium]|nr:SusC/RagA family TonB-linked outer membrane protein [Bacteroidales bacterium]